MTASQKKYVNLVIKVLILICAFWYVLEKVSDQSNIIKFKTLVKGLEEYSVVYTLFVILILMFVNWLLEVFKWQYLSRRIEQITFWKAFQSVFCGLTLAIFTPNRIGEYGGRVMFLRPPNRAKGAVAMGVGLFAQLVLTSVAGALSSAWFICRFLHVPPSMQFGIWVLAILYAAAFVILYFNVRWIDLFVRRIAILRKIRRYFAVLKEYSPPELLMVLLYSLVRFVIFTSQYIILMKLTLPQIPFVSMVLMIFILFFVQSALPTVDIFDFSVRSFVASNLYSYITDQEIAVMAIVSCIWFVNLILPAIFGSIFVFKINFFGDTKS